MYPQIEATMQLPPMNSSRIEEHGVNIRDYVDQLIEGRKTILLTLLPLLLVTSIYLVLVPPTYKADALLHIDNNNALLAAPLQSEVNGASVETDNPAATG